MLLPTLFFRLIPDQHADARRWLYLYLALHIVLLVVCDGIGVERARGGGRRERVERACIDTGQPEG